MMERRRGLWIEVRDPVTTMFLLVCVVGPLIGFFVGYMATIFYPNLTNLTKPLICQNGTLQTNESSYSSSPGSVSYKLTVNCLTNGAQQDVTSQFEITDGFAFAIAALIIGGLIAIGKWALQPADI